MHLKKVDAKRVKIGLFLHQGITFRTPGFTGLTPYLVHVADLSHFSPFPLLLVPTSSRVSVGESGKLNVQ